MEEQEALKKAFHGALPGGGDSEEDGDDAGLVLKSRSVPEAGKGASDGGKEVDKVGRRLAVLPVLLGLTCPAASGPRCALPCPVSRRAAPCPPLLSSLGHSASLPSPAPQPRCPSASGSCCALPTFNHHSRSMIWYTQPCSPPSG